jgi:hypothetical protein
MPMTNQISVSTGVDRGARLAPVNRKISPIPFPLTFACDMIPGLEAMSNLKKATDIEEAFLTQFTGCIYSKATFYRHRHIYEQAAAANVLQKFLEFGHSEAGKWSNVVKGPFFSFFICNFLIEQFSCQFIA